MCGISGFVEKNKTADQIYARNMVSILEHRGPDDRGMEFFSLGKNKNVKNGVIGFDRLSIRDLSSNGHQPMLSEDGKVILAFNGEIYNSEIYRDELIQKGYNFQSRSDTEVLLRLYEEYGVEGMLQKINGMYAICIMDNNLDQLFLIRDRLGEKPLYYYKTDTLLIFASEIKAFYMHDDFTPVLNEKVLDEYLVFSYVAGSSTLLKNVYSVCPGHYLVFDGQILADREYWNLSGVRHAPKKKPDLLAFEEALKKSIQSRLVSDVPVGVELSGGIDSSLVSMYCNTCLDEVRAYSVIFDEEYVNEEKYIDYVTEKYNIKCNKLKFKEEAFLNTLEKCTWHFDAPINHRGSVALYNLCKKLKGVSPVVLTGEGADELLGGYEWYNRIAFYQHNKFYTTLKRVWHTFNGKQQWVDLKGINEEERHILMTSNIELDVLKKLRGDDVDLNHILGERLKIFHRLGRERNNVIRKLNYEMSTYMVDLLIRQDKMSMAGSVECRVPFVDTDFVEYVRSNIPARALILKARKENVSKKSKIILKRLAEKYFNYDFVYRKKMGLPLPLAEFYNDKGFDSYFRNHILPGIKKRNLMDADYILKIWKDKTNINLAALWNVINFEIWAQIFLDNHGWKVRKMWDGKSAE